ncbi:MAG: hypothetical protein AB7P02_19320 [Alphaproteobacteria bacterium]
MSVGDDFRFGAAEDMTPQGGFRDSWKWSLPVLAGGAVVALLAGIWLALFGAPNDHVDKRVDYLLQAAIALGLGFGGAARYDAHSRRRAVVSWETTKLQVAAASAQRTGDLDAAAG